MFHVTNDATVDGASTCENDESNPAQTRKALLFLLGLEKKIHFFLLLVNKESKMITTVAAEPVDGFGRYANPSTSPDTKRNKIPFLFFVGSIVYFIYVFTWGRDTYQPGWLVLLMLFVLLGTAGSFRDVMDLPSVSENH